MFGDGLFNGTMQNVVGPTLVAMEMKFGLGVEMQSPTGLFNLSITPACVGPEVNFCDCKISYSQ